jgi:integrase
MTGSSPCRPALDAGEEDQLRAMLAAGMKTPAIALKLRRTVSAVRTRKTVLNKREAGPNPHTQRSHMQSCKRFAAWLQRSPDTATPDEVRRFQLYLVESGMSICNRNRIMTGVRFLFRITLRRHGLEAEVGHIKEPQNLPPVLSPEEVKRVLIMATSLKARTMLSLALGCGLRASEVVRPRAADIDSELIVIRIVQSKPAHSSTMPACCRPARAAGHRHGHATHAALPLPLPALWRPHDRNRDLRARLRTDVAPDAEQDRHIMSQTSRERRNFHVPTRGPYAGSDPFLHSTHRALVDPFRACRDAYYTLPISPACRSAGRIPSTSHPPSSSAPPSNPDSARCSAGAQTPATSCLGAFWTPAATARGKVRHAGVQNLHTSGLIRRSKTHLHLISSLDLVRSWSAPVIAMVLLR